MSMPATNPRAVAGDNQAPDHGVEVTRRLEADYAETAKVVTELLNEARALPKEVTSEADVGTFSDLVVKLRDAKTRIAGFHGLEKQPYLRGGEACDQFFFTLWGKLTKQGRGKNDPDGAVEVLTRRVNAYQTKIQEEERRRRLEEEEEARKVAAAAEETRLKAEQLAREKEDAAKRARNPEKKAALLEEAQDHKVDAKVAEVTEAAARTNLSEKQAASTAKPADLVRSRSDGGTMATMRQVGYTEITNADLLDLQVLRPFIKEAHLKMALDAWAKVTGHKKPMPGAIVEMRNDTVIR